MASDGIQIASGMASSAACAAQRLGAEVSLWASAGDDSTGDLLVSGIAAEGVDCSIVRRVAGGRSAPSAILVDAQGERIIVPYTTAATQADPASLPFSNRRAAFDAVMVDVRWPGRGRTGPRCRDAQRWAARRQSSMPTSAPLRRAGAPPAARLARRRIRARGSHASLSQCAPLPPARPACAAAVRARRTLFVGGDGRSRRAPAGSAGGGPTGACSASPRAKITAVDTLAAGDVFHGAFAVGLGRGDADRRRCSASPAPRPRSSAQRFGGRLGAPTRLEVEEAVARWWPA